MAEFVTRKENKRRLWTLIACLVLDAGALALGIMALTKLNDLEKKPENNDTIIKVRGRVAEARASVQKLWDNFYGFAPYIGSSVQAVTSADRLPTSRFHPEELKKFINQFLENPKTNEKETEAEKQDRRKKSLLGRLDIAKYKPWDDAGPGDPLYLTTLLEVLLKKEDEYKARIVELDKRVEAERAEEKQLVADIDAENKKALAEIIGPSGPNDKAAGRIANLITLEQQLNENQRKHAEKLVTLDKEAFESQGSVTKVRNENLRKLTEKENEKKEFAKRIYTLRSHREEARERREADGEILSVNNGMKLAYISLLRKDRLFKGTKFHVYSLEKGGVKVDNGELEVIEVREDLSSVCSIEKVYDPEWPIRAGDKIYNELYEGGRPRYIAFAGRLMGRLSNEDAAALIRSFGDFYQEKADEKTNYVVVGEGYEADPNFKTAKEFGIKILLERYLHDYLGVKSK